MKHRVSIFVMTIIALGAAVQVQAQDAAAPEPAEPAPAPPAGLTTVEQQAGYAIGLRIGGDFKAQGIDVDAQALADGIADALAGNPAKLTPEQMQAAMQALQMAVIEKHAAKGEANKAAGEKFQAENKAKENVKTLPSGLQYEVVQPGKGKSPTAADTVKVHYRGTLIDGTEFDSSYARGEPAVFPVGGVIPGWTEVLQLMKEGDKWRVVIPPALAYGERGAGPDIGPNATLVFDIELLEVLGPAADPHAGHGH